jgi:2-polyprenyl-3-methyl-5-hydroxy-6-metoxy-1,4-benzoquinol methylase
MDSAYAAAYPELYRRHWWWRVREEILLRTIARILDDRPAPRRILDVGCGAGLFFDALQRFGHVEGIESDRDAVEMAGRWKPNIFVGQLDGSYSPDEAYDVILMLDVLEHLTEPEPLLRHARQLLKPGGCILITVPAFTWLWTRHDDMNHHVRRYTRSAMRTTLRGAGLVVADATYLFQSLVFPKAIVRVMESLQKSPPSVPRIPGAWLNDALQTWLRNEYALGRWLPFGTSLMVVARTR